MSVWGWLKKAWAALDQVPDCPTCRGTGTAPDHWHNHLVWWRGRQEWACWQCDGAGKI